MKTKQSNCIFARLCLPRSLTFQLMQQRRFSGQLGRSAALLLNLTLGLTLAVAHFFVPAGMGTAQAATTTCTPTAIAPSSSTTPAPPRRGPCRRA